MASKRFPNKPMAEIHGIPMIERVWRQAIDSEIGDVFVACCERVVFDLITSKGGKEVVEAEAPLAELFGYSTALRSRTQGRGSFSMSFVRYTPLQSELEKKFFEERGISINF